MSANLHRKWRQCTNCSARRFTRHTSHFYRSEGRRVYCGVFRVDRYPPEEAVF